MKKPLISIIVPVYNVEQYLDRCLDSIVNQTYSNLEIILVDDGSTDGCSDICDEWKKKDKRIKVIHKENGGMSDARNVGLDNSVGDYIGFVDSDDYIDLNMYSHMFTLINEYKADIASCEMEKFSNQVPISNESSSENIRVLNGKESISALLNETYFKCTVPNLLIRSSVAKQVKFDEGKIHEDILWPYRTLKLCNRSIYTSKTLYYYFQREGSIMNSAYSIKRFDALDALQQRSIDIKKNYPDLYKKALASYLGSCTYHYRTLCRYPKSKEYKKYKRIVFSRYMDEDRKYAFDGEPLRYMMWRKLFEFSPNVASKLINKYEDLKS